MNIEKLIEITKKEKLLNEIFPYERNLIKEITKEIELQEEYLENTKKNVDNLVLLEIKELELERIKFILKTYFKTRLLKIENNLFYIIKNNLMNQLSKEEIIYFKNFTQIYMKNLNNSFFKLVNEDIGKKLLYGNIKGDSKIKFSEDITQPTNKINNIIIKCLDEVSEYKIDNKLISFDKNSYLIGSLDSLKELILNKKAELILD